MNYHISFDDYCPDNFKLAKLLLKHNLPATFFIEIEHNGDRRNPMLQIKALSEMGFDIGCHSLDHSILRNLEDFDQDVQIVYAKDLIENITGKTPTWFCPPKGRYDEKVVNKILEANFQYIRTVDVLDNSKLVYGLNKTTIHIYPRKEYKGDKWNDLAVEYIKSIHDPEMCFKLWGHGWEISKYNQWKEVEEIFERLNA